MDVVKTSAENTQGNWRSGRLRAAGIAYAEIVRRLDVSQQTERNAIAGVLLKMTNGGCLKEAALVQRCISRVHPLAVGDEMSGIAAVAAKEAAEFVTN